jgi:EAL domain-containing protein (putative c-di-GMP-specific phosphodiesterase class I)
MSAPDPSVLLGKDDATTAAPAPSLSNIERVFARVLDLVRDQLGMELAWISEFAHGEQVLRGVSGDADSFGVYPGFCSPEDQSYCSRVLSGALPNIVPDAKADERTRDLPVTAQLDIGAYIGVPVTLEDGSVYGMLCSFSHGAETDLGPRDVRLLQLLAKVVGEEVQREQVERERRTETRARVDAALNGEALRVVFQPIVDIASRQMVAAEALSRFDREPRNPATWFADAADLGLGLDLELAAIGAAVEQLDGLPPGIFLSVNASPATACSPDLHALLARDGVASRVFVEITERAEIADYDAMNEGFRRLRQLGTGLAVDDAGAGYASLRHILWLKPEVIKLDMGLTRDVDSDPAREALTRALVGFARQMESMIVAEGVETEAEFDALAALGVDSVQGYLMARPGPLPLTVEAQADPRALLRTKPGEPGP